MKYLVCLFCVILFTLSFAQAAITDADVELIVINSNNWEDVYAGMLYGQFSNVPVVFLTTQDQSQDFINGLVSPYKKIILLESDTNRVSSTVARSLRNKGYEIEVITQEDFTLFLGSVVESDSLIVVDKNYPGNSVVVSPYAILTESWVVFVDDTNINSVVNFIDDSFSSITYYGLMPENFLNRVPEGITIDEGNKYANNIELVNLFLEKKSIDQAVFSDGSFIERSFFEDFPVILIGKSSVPRQVVDFVAQSPITFGVVIGADSVDNGLQLKTIVESEDDRYLGLFAKLAKTSSDLSTPNDIQSLDLFYIPNPKISIEVTAIQYNQITNELELIFANNGDVRTYYVPTITLVVDGETIILESEEDYYTLTPDRFETLVFPIELDSTSSVSASITTVFGDSPDSFEFSIISTFDEVPFITVRDESSIVVKEILYSVPNGAFIISVENNGSVDAYVDLSLDDLIVGGQPISVSSLDVVRIPANERANIVIYQELSDLDIQVNEQISYFAKYGQREGVLVKVASGTLPLRTGSFLDYFSKPIVYIPVIVLVVFILLLWFVLRGSSSSYMCLSCGQVQKSSSKPCMACGYNQFRKQR